MAREVATGIVVVVVGLALIASQRGKPRGWSWRQRTPIQTDRLRFVGYAVAAAGLFLTFLGLLRGLAPAN